jgi:hypothetical protein
MACSGYVRIYEVQETRPVVSTRHASDWILVLRAVFDRLGLRPQCEGLPLIEGNERRFIANWQCGA